MSYQIIDWNKHYENNRSRQVERLQWVSLPNRHDGEGYSIIMADERAAEVFTAWILLIQVASKCNPRGSLVRDDGTPMSLRAISLKTRGDLKWFEYAIPKLLEVGWIQPLTSCCDNGAPERHASDAQVTSGCEEGMEEKEQKEENQKRPMGSDSFTLVEIAISEIHSSRTPKAFSPAERNTLKELRSRITDEELIADAQAIKQAKNNGWEYFARTRPALLSKWEPQAESARSFRVSSKPASKQDFTKFAF